MGRPLFHACRRVRDAARESLAAPSVTSHLMGGCGNQIFQYATGFALARRLGTRLMLDISYYDAPGVHRVYSLDLFKGVQARLVRKLSGPVIREEGYPYNPGLFENLPRRFSLYGYWPCEQYFFGLREELGDQLVPRKPLPAFQREIERQIAEAGKRSVFLHVRRTDYVGNPFHVALPLDYYRKAAALIAAKVPDPVFFIFSDDPEWCDKNLDLPYRAVTAENSGTEASNNVEGREDAVLWLMRRCNHAVIANSSLSWWGAWLGADVGGGIIVAPCSWLGPAFTEDPRDIVPHRWARL